MKTISAALDTHLQGELTTLATCWKVTRTDGQIFGFTEHNKNLTVTGVTYEAMSGLNRSSIRSTAKLSVDNMDIDGALISDAITEEDLRSGKWDDARIECFVVNWADLTMGIMRQPGGYLGQVQSGEIVFSAELRGLMWVLQQSRGHIYQPTCDAILGDSRCTLNLAAFTFNATVISIVSNAQFTLGSLAQATDYFSLGKLTFTSGDNDGFSADIKDHTLVSGNASISLQLDMPFDVQVGDTVTIIAGDDKLHTTCRDKFNNLPNFRGFPYLPGLDSLLQGT